ncbi:hypothetical protein RE6C_01519 [Rhodopirellula europaea 6C]|uniref:Uncharacterized protein n=1 Tax=Rhodopirellula europaea 6C TaxID=1263867 RepID=M2AYG4_9BACT|nr:hypothetical protein RE6C_01519 [Rhodopirellula europaea 6C]
MLEGSAKRRHVLQALDCGDLMRSMNVHQGLFEYACSTFAIVIANRIRR